MEADPENTVCWVEVSEEAAQATGWKLILPFHPPPLLSQSSWTDGKQTTDRFVGTSWALLDALDSMESDHAKAVLLPHSPSLTLTLTVTLLPCPLLPSWVRSGAGELEAWSSLLVLDSLVCQ